MILQEYLSDHSYVSAVRADKINNTQSIYLYFYQIRNHAWQSFLQPYLCKLNMVQSPCVGPRHVDQLDQGSQLDRVDHVHQVVRVDQQNQVYRGDRVHLLDQLDQMDRMDQGNRVGHRWLLGDIIYTLYINQK